MTRPPQVVLPGDPDADTPQWWQRAVRLRRIPMIAAVIVTILLIKAMSSSTPPALETSCTAPAFALSSYTLTGHQELRWSATGPSGTRFALAIGAIGLRPTPSGALQPIPAPGVDADDVRVSPSVQIADDCTQHGALGVILPAGKYQAGMFVVEPDAKSSEMIQPIAAKELTVSG